MRSPEPARAEACHVYGPSIIEGLERAGYVVLAAEDYRSAVLALQAATRRYEVAEREIASRDRFMASLWEGL